MNDEIQWCYRVLELPAGATEEDVKVAYKLLVKVWHPDRFPGDENLRYQAEEKLKAINAARERLLSYLNEPASVPPNRPPGAPSNAKTSNRSRDTAPPSQGFSSRDATSKSGFAAFRKQSLRFRWRAMARDLFAVVAIAGAIFVVATTLVSNPARNNVIDGSDDSNIAQSESLGADRSSESSYVESKAADPRPVHSSKAQGKSDISALPLRWRTGNVLDISFSAPFDLDQRFTAAAGNGLLAYPLATHEGYSNTTNATWGLHCVIHRYSYLLLGSVMIDDEVRSWIAVLRNAIGADTFRHYRIVSTPLTVSGLVARQVVLRPGSPARGPYCDFLIVQSDNTLWVVMFDYWNREEYEDIVAGIIRSIQVTWRWRRQY